MDGVPERGSRDPCDPRPGAPTVEQDAPSVPIYQTATFRFDSSEAFAETINFRRPGYTYTRGYGNPTLLAFERVMAELEGTESAISFASAAAIHTVVTTLASSGDTAVASSSCTADVLAVRQRAAAVRRRRPVRQPARPRRGARRPGGAAFLYVETIANPNVTVADLEALGSVAARPACRASSTTRSRRRISATRRRTGSTTCCTRPRSTSAGTPI